MKKAYEEALKAIAALDDKEREAPTISNIMGMISIEIESFVTARNCFFKALNGYGCNTDFL